MTKTNTTIFTVTAIEEFDEEIFKKRKSKLDFDLYSSTSLMVDVTFNGVDVSDNLKNKVVREQIKEILMEIRDWSIYNKFDNKLLCK